MLQMQSASLLQLLVQPLISLFADLGGKIMSGVRVADLKSSPHIAVNGKSLF